MIRGPILQQASLWKSQRDGEICLHAGIEDLTRRGFQSTRNINSN